MSLDTLQEIAHLTFTHVLMCCSQVKNKHQNLVRYIQNSKEFDLNMAVTINCFAYGLLILYFWWVD
jgi:hypothetical protein